MILVDTSVWVDHLRQTDTRLQEALIDQRVLMHPFVLGEIACGNLHIRSSILDELAQLPSAVFVESDEVLSFIEQHRLFGRGIGWIDCHLLASAVLTHCQLWTSDLRLRDMAGRLKLA
jgi:predicted nucleic acid-binding protein